MNKKTALKIILFIIGIVVLFHLSIMLKIVPYDIVWGGNLETDQQMYVFEIISITINLFLAWILLIKGALIKPVIPIKTVHIILWVFVILFGLNTLGNIIAKTYFEKFFAVATLLLALLLIVVLKKDKKV